jgi:hypothetical protein
MEGKKNNFMGDIYTSYGPFVGKVCENTNTQLHQDNIIESITSSISPNSLNISNNTSPVDKLDRGTLINTHQDMGPVDVIPMIKQTHKLKGSKKIKFGGDINKQIISEPVVNDKTNLVDEETGSFFNYKISIYNHKISIWILLLILLVIICIGYFIYKYWYLKNTSIITYKKSNSEETNEELSTDSEDETENSTTSSSSNNTSK